MYQSQTRNQIYWGLTKLVNLFNKAMKNVLKDNKKHCIVLKCIENKSRPVITGRFI